MHSDADAPENMYIVRPQYEYGIKSHNPHSSPYLATAAQQVTACSLSYSYSTSVHYVQ